MWPFCGQRAKTRNLRANASQKWKPKPWKKHTPGERTNTLTNIHFGSQNRCQNASRRLQKRVGGTVGHLSGPTCVPEAPRSAKKDPTEAPVQLESRSARVRRGRDAGATCLFWAPGAPRDGLARALLEEKQHHKTFAQDLTRFGPEGRRI